MTSDLCLIIFLTGKGEALVEQYMPLAEHFRTDKVSITYLYTNEEPRICKQFGVTGQTGAVIYKPKRNRYVKLEDYDQTMVEPSKLQKFIENVLHGGSIQWQVV
jgi:hypothetical protein